MSAARKLTNWEAPRTLGISLQKSRAANDNAVQALDDARENSRLGIFVFAYASLPACEPANDGIAAAKSEAQRRNASEPGITGKEEDVEVGLQYFGKRYLNPLLGRWISADPLAVHAPGSADLNLYAYVSGAVLKNVDPLGLEETNAEQGNKTENAAGDDKGALGEFTVTGCGHNGMADCAAGGDPTGSYLGPEDPEDPSPGASGATSDSTPEVKPPVPPSVSPTSTDMFSIRLEVPGLGGLKLSIGMATTRIGNTDRTDLVLDTATSPKFLSRENLALGGDISLTNTQNGERPESLGNYTDTTGSFQLKLGPVIDGIAETRTVEHDNDATEYKTSVGGGNGAVNGGVDGTVRVEGGEVRFGSAAAGGIGPLGVKINTDGVVDTALGAGARAGLSQLTGEHYVVRDWSVFEF